MKLHLSSASVAKTNSILPGTQIVDVISTEHPESRAASVIMGIAKSYKGLRIYRDFSQGWENENGILVNKGTIGFVSQDSPEKNKTYHVTLKIGTQEGLVLKNVPGSRWSLKPTKEGLMELEVGEQVKEEQLESRIGSFIGCWVVHGRDWYDRAGRRTRQPYGLERKYTPPDQFYFNVIDGMYQPKITLKELIGSGCTRSTHVGNWHQRHSTLIPAICGMSLTLHEFKDGGGDICSFNGVSISNDVKKWGPYCSWNEVVRHSDQLGLWKHLALRSASPFSFHVHATRMLFPNSQLDSHFILEEIGKGKFREILQIMVMSEPERFYRLIDENGVTHRLTGCGQEYFEYGSYGNFSRHAVVDNILETFEQLQLVQFDCAHVLSRKARIVIDTHAYLVIEALATGFKKVYVLSGRDMHAYLTDGTSEKMHRVRNERLFLALRDLFGVKSIDFYVYPPLSMNSGLNSQYQDLNFCDKESWLTKEVA